MWYDKVHMRLFFYGGAMLFIVGLGLWMSVNAIFGVTVVCIGIALLIIGFYGLRFNLMVETNMRRKQERIKRNRELLKEQQEKKKEE